MEHLNKILADSAKHGAILGIALVILMVLIYVSNIHLFYFYGIFLLLMFIVGQIIYTLRSQKRFRNSIGGRISFKQLFVYGLVLLVVSSIISNIFNFVLFTVIDSEYLNQMVDNSVVDWLALVPEMNVDDMYDSLEEAALEMKSLKGALIGAIKAPIIISLILALIIKKDINEQ